MLVLVGLGLASGCRAADHAHEANMSRPARPIDQVLHDHAAELMALPGVVGVYQGALKDGTPCIAVMVVKKTRELDTKIPDALEGHPVRIDETGEIRPR